MIKKAKPLFHYTKSEKRGIAVLLILISVLLIFRIILPYWFTGPKINSIVVEHIGLDTLKSSSSYKGLEFEESNSNHFQTVKCCVNPNTATREEIVKAGFSTFAASNIIKYRNTGASFDQIEDMYKIYGIDSNHKDLIENVIIIPPKEGLIDKPARTKRVIKTIDINLADTFQLNSLPGIGNVLASRIVKYRNMLGGFYAIDQLAEVYGLSDSTIQRLMPYVEVATEHQKININGETAKVLAKHPYVTKYQAKTIIKYRKLTGNAISNETLNELNVFTESEVQRLMPYLMLKDSNLD